MSTCDLYSDLYNAVSFTLLLSGYVDFQTHYSGGSRMDAYQNEKGGYGLDFLKGVWEGLQTICLGKFAST